MHVQVKKLFRRAFIVGKRYPIVHVCDGPVIHEVSSFQTNTDAKLIPQDISSLMDDKVQIYDLSPAPKCTSYYSPVLL